MQLSVSCFISFDSSFNFDFESELEILEPLDELSELSKSESEIYYI